MRILLCILGAGLVWAQQTVVSAPRISRIEFFGLHHVTATLARQALGLKDGDPLPESKSDAEKRLLDVDRIAAANLAAVCCENSKTVLYVGIEERDAPRYEIRFAPGGEEKMPEDVIRAYRKLDSSQRNPVRLVTSSPLGGPVDAHLEELRNVLRDSGNERDRALAAEVLPYAPNKAEIVNDLHEALTDNEGDVRAAAMRSLTLLGDWARTNPAAKVHVSAEWFVPMLQSVFWSDRTQTVAALEKWSAAGDRAAAQVLLDTLHGDALDSLIEMAGWRSEQYAYPAFILIGRVAGFGEADIRDAWLRGGRDEVITKARAKSKP